MAVLFFNSVPGEGSGRERSFHDRAADQPPPARSPLGPSPHRAGAPTQSHPDLRFIGRRSASEPGRRGEATASPPAAAASPPGGPASEQPCLQVLDVGWPELHAPPLDKVCAICKAQESWLHSDPQHVVVIHCRVRQPGWGALPSRNPSGRAGGSGLWTRPEGSGLGHSRLGVRSPGSAFKEEKAPESAARTPPFPPPRSPPPGLVFARASWAGRRPMGPLSPRGAAQAAVGGRHPVPRASPRSRWRCHHRLEAAPRPARGESAGTLTAPSPQGGKGRIGVVIACYMHFTNVSAR